MDIITFTNFGFTYPGGKVPALREISVSIASGSFVTLCGKSGCGKSTLLRNLKPILAPCGEKTGSCCFMGREVTELSHREQSESIGFVLQNPESQLVTDKVWHELAFGLESLGCSTTEIRAKVAEMAAFFGIEAWFHRNVSELSGGQKQLLNLASVMVMQPDVLVLDEPTAQLDPISAQNFLDTLAKINRELGTTVILSEHRLEEAFALSDRVIVLDDGAMIADGLPHEVGAQLKAQQHDMLSALSTAMRVHAAIENDLPCPVTVRQGRLWLSELQKKKQPVLTERKRRTDSDREPTLEMREVWFRYEKNMPDVLRGVSFRAYAGELYAIVGGNGSGKTTALSVLAGLYDNQRGDILYNGKGVTRACEKPELHVAVLPQNPQGLFVEKSVYADLLEIFSRQRITQEEQEARIRDVVALCELEQLMDRHPHDLSGGEQQRAALAKILLMRPQILLLDEPTKGMDAHFKKKLALIFRGLKERGVTLVMVSHDVEFCAQYADRCAMFFDGSIVSEDVPETFFAGKNFYTTAANRMARDVLPRTVLAEDIITAFGGILEEPSIVLPQDVQIGESEQGIKSLPKKKSNHFFKRSFVRVVLGLLFALILAGVIHYFHHFFPDYSNGQVAVQFAELLLTGACIGCFVPMRKRRCNNDAMQQPKEKRKLKKRTLLAMFFVVVVAPLTLFAGIYLFSDKKYYLISLLLILETMIPFFLLFEEKKLQARELVMVSVLCALAVGGRTAFYMIPQFKPILAMVILIGICFGGETGFLAGAISGFVSNFFFGQGPWTPWQMIAFGFVGFLAGILFHKGILRRSRLSLSIFGGLATMLVYGLIVNIGSALMMNPTPTLSFIVSTCVLGVPFDLIHAGSTAMFLWFLAEPMIEKIERMNIKYGIMKI